MLAQRVRLGVQTKREQPKKENPAVGAPGYIIIVIGVYGFNYAAWLRAVSRLLSLLFAQSSQCVVVFAALTSSSYSISCSSSQFQI